MRTYVYEGCTEGILWMLYWQIYGCAQMTAPGGFWILDTGYWILDLPSGSSVAAIHWPIKSDA